MSIRKELRAKSREQGANSEKLRSGVFPIPRSIRSMLYALCAALYILCFLMFPIAGCSVPGQSTDALFAAAESHLANARKSGAEQLAEPEFREAEALLVEAEAALKNGDKGSRSLIEKAHAKARLAEALTRKSRAEAEADRLEKELEKASAEADSVRKERELSESELKQESPDQ